MRACGGLPLLHYRCRPRPQRADAARWLSEARQSHSALSESPCSLRLFNRSSGAEIGRRQLLGQQSPESLYVAVDEAAAQLETARVAARVGPPGRVRHELERLRDVLARAQTPAHAVLDRLVLRAPFRVHLVGDVDAETLERGGEVAR